MDAFNGVVESCYIFGKLNWRDAVASHCPSKIASSQFSPIIIVFWIAEKLTSKQGVVLLFVGYANCLCWWLVIHYSPVLIL